MTNNTLKLIDEYLTQGGYSPGIDSEALESEATLIAAAPNLLAALEGLADCAGITALSGYRAELDAAMQNARAAIAKAKGQ